LVLVYGFAFFLISFSLMALWRFMSILSLCKSVKLEAADLELPSPASDMDILELIKQVKFGSHYKA
jgi:hypothetical protein